MSYDLLLVDGALTDMTLPFFFFVFFFFEMSDSHIVDSLLHEIITPDSCFGPVD